MKSHLQKGWGLANLKMALAMFFLASASLCFADGARRVPFIRNVGIIPLQVQGVDDPLTYKGQLSLISASLVRGVEESKRFVLLDHDLVAASWSNAAGRSELAKEYEVHAFFGAEFQPKGDAVMVFARLMDPNLQTMLLESITIPNHQLRQMSDAVLEQQVKDLCFRLLNRLPLDTYITSIQGKYVTLSSGSVQGLRVKDLLNVERAFVVLAHPVTGSWLRYRKEVVGELQVIEVKKATAVAEITKMTHDGAIQVADGGRIPAIASRLRFSNMANEQGLQPADTKLEDQQQVSIPHAVEPLYDEQGQRNHQADAESELIEDEHQRDSAPIVKRSANQEPVKDSDAKAQGEDQGNSWTQDLNFDAGAFFRSLWGDAFNGVLFSVGPKMWGTYDAAEVASGFSPLQVLRFNLNKKVIEHLSIEADVRGMFGSTENGVFSGVETLARALWIDNDRGSFTWFVGGGIGFSSLGVTQERFGGWDMGQMHLGGGIKGSLELGNMPIAWHAALWWQPLHLGTIGLAGSKSPITSSSIQQIDLGLYFPQGKDRLEWGIGLERSMGQFEMEAATLGWRELIIHLGARLSL